VGARSGRKLVAFDRRLGARFVAGADEAGRGSLAGPLVAAAVLLDYDYLRGPRLTPLSSLNDSKQLLPDERERLFHAVLRLAAHVSVQVVSPGEIDRNGLHRSNLRALARALRAVGHTAEMRLVDGFKLGPTAPPHRAVVDGDEKSAAIAAASVVAKVVRDRAMRRLDALYPAFGFVSHVGYITPGHSAVVRRRGPCALHRRSFQALCNVDSPVEHDAGLDLPPAELIEEALASPGTEPGVATASEGSTATDAEPERGVERGSAAGDDLERSPSQAWADAEDDPEPEARRGKPFVKPTARSRAA
jgi:ribonuclease HII